MRGNRFRLVWGMMVAIPIAAHAQNLVVNGDFSQGNVGFTSNFNFYNNQTFDQGRGYYTVGTNPHTYNSNWPNMGDHTTGNGNMMIIHSQANTIAWYQGLPLLSVGATYKMSFWLASFDIQDPLTLKFGVGNLTTISTPLTAGVWTQYSVNFTPTTTGFNNAEIECVSNGYAQSGFGLDDISVTQVQAAPEPSSMLLVLGSLALVWLRRSRA